MRNWLSGCEVCVAITRLAANKRGYATERRHGAVWLPEETEVNNRNYCQLAQPQLIPVGQPAAANRNAALRPRQTVTLIRCSSLLTSAECSRYVANLFCKPVLNILHIRLRCQKDKCHLLKVACKLHYFACVNLGFLFGDVSPRFCCFRKFHNATFFET